MARCIARDAGVEAGDFVLEVGVGCGFLSVQLAARGVRLLGVEIDRRLLEVASGFLAPWEGVRLIGADVLAGKNRLAKEVRDLLPEEEPWHLVSNLPYGVAGPLLVVLSRLPHPPESMTALVQAEVAERITAEARETAWGPLGARLAPLYSRTRVRSVGANLFWPRPRVESAVVHLELHRDFTGKDPLDLVAFDDLVGELFRRRRKRVRTTLVSILGDGERAEALLREAGVDPSARPETLGAHEFQKLAASPLWRASRG
jgi:16S rRNA (adenine1518-N6/adenine1519-N6)-dimethyltransferase